MRVISTKYSGYKFRSRTEARWAVYFDEIGLEWEYEKEGYVLDDGTWYLPDFYIKGFGWIEIKGDEANDKEIEKAKLLSKSGTTVAIFSGIPSKDVKEYPCYSDGKESCGVIFSKYSVRKWGAIPYYGEFTLSDDDIVCINKARSARFEHGRKG